MNSKPDMIPLLGRKAMVVLSGGMDSTIAFYWAMALFKEVETITFHYGQRHQTEIIAASDISSKTGVRWTLVDLLSYGKATKTAFTQEQIKRADSDHLTTNYSNVQTVGKDLVFYMTAASIAFSRGIRDIVIGACRSDITNTFEIQEDTLRALEKTIRIGFNQTINIHAPLLHLSKKEEVELAKTISISGPYKNTTRDCWNVLAETITCHHGFLPGCGKCSSCFLRGEGFKLAGYEDPGIK